MNMVTIKDVAQDAGVSVGTVSNVINGVKVGDERRQRVEASIQKLGYQVNYLARGMRAQKTDYVVVLLPDIRNPFYALLLESLERELTAVGKHPILCLGGRDSEKEEGYIEMAKSNKVDGIIGTTYGDVESYLTESMPFVSIERRFESWIPCVSCDNFRGGQLAAEQLVKRGARNLLCFLVLASADNEVRKRRSGFASYCAEHDVTYGVVEFSENQVPTIYSSYSSRGLVRDVLQAYLRNAPDKDPIDGIFAGTDHLAVVICEELQAMGKRVPEDIQVIGFDGLKFMNAGRQIVSSIYQDTGLIAKKSVESLMKLMNGEKTSDIVDLAVEFVEGGTTRPQAEEQGTDRPIGGRQHDTTDNDPA